MTSLLMRLYESAANLNRQNILDLVADRQYADLCDLGCDDGEWTAVVARHAKAERIYGIEIVPERARLARSHGIDVAESDLMKPFPYSDESFDLVHANQVVEHVGDIDHFFAETRRVLRVGGVAVISTENGSSWHNIFAAVMGWQIFSLTNVSKRRQGLGNPLAMHRGSHLELETWTHKTIFNYRGLLEVLEVHGFEVIQATGAGYHPLPAYLGRLDRRRSHFITMKAAKTGP